MDRRNVNNPELMVGAGMLARAYHDFEELKESWTELDESMKDLIEHKVKIKRMETALRRFATSRSICQAHVQWLHEEGGDGIPFEELCESLNRNPEAIRDKYFKGIPRLIMRILARGRGYCCPVCEAMH
jgi:hypothetical protein